MDPGAAGLAIIGFSNHIALANDPYLPD